MEDRSIAARSVKNNPEAYRPASDVEPAKTARVHIAFFLTTLAPGGAQIQLLNFIRKLPENIRVSVVTIKAAGVLATAFNEAGIAVYPQNFQRRFPPLAFLQLLKQVRMLKPDVVFTVGYGDSMFWGRLSAILSGVKCIYSSIHTLSDLGDFDRPNLMLNRYNTRFFPVAESIARRMLEKYRLPVAKVSPLANGVEYNHIAQAVSSMSVADQQQTTTGKPAQTTILHVGKLIHYKRQALTIEAVHKLVRHDDITGLRCLLVGDGPDNAMLQKMISDLNLEGHVKLIGQVSHDDCLQLIAKSAVVVLPSSSEAFPNILVECGFLKKPVVAADVGGISEIVRHEKSGFIFEKPDKDQYYRYLKRLLLSTELCREFGEYGYNHVNQHFTLEKKVQKFLNYLAVDLNRT